MREVITWPDVATVQATRPLLRERAMIPLGGEPPVTLRFNVFGSLLPKPTTTSEAFHDGFVMDPILALAPGSRVFPMKGEARRTLRYRARRQKLALPAIVTLERSSPPNLIRPRDRRVGGEARLTLGAASLRDVVPTPR